MSWNEISGGAMLRKNSIIRAFLLISLTILISFAGGSSRSIGETLPPATIPGKALGGGGNDFALSVQQTFDGGYIIAGAANSKGAGGYDVYLLRTDSAGNILKEKTFGGTGNDFGFSVQQTRGGGFILTGVYSVVNMISAPIPPFKPGFPFEVEGQIFLKKLDGNLEPVWEQTTAIAGGFTYTQGYAVQQTPDGGFIVAGAAGVNLGDPGTYVVKTDAVGNVQWSTRPVGKLGTGVRGTSDGGYVISADRYSMGPGYILRINSGGAVQWSTPMNGTANSIWTTADGGYITTGGKDDVFVGKVDANGTRLWEKTLGSAGDIGYSIQETLAGGIIIAGAGSGGGPNHGYDIYLIRTDADGNLQWQKYYGGLGDDVGRSVRQTSDGGYIIAGRTMSIGAGGYDIYLVKTDSNGNVQWGSGF
jgi:hypothetical protein